MARTAIPIYVIPPYQDGVEPVDTNGDAANDHSVDLTTAPKLHLNVSNSGANTIAFSFELPAGTGTYSEAISVSASITSGQFKIYILDLPSDLAQSGNLLHIDSADANFSDLRFRAYTWSETPNSGGGSKSHG